MVFQQVVKSAVELGCAYGSTPADPNSVILVNPATFTDTLVSSPASIDLVRALILSEHVAALMDANGYV